MAHGRHHNTSNDDVDLTWIGRQLQTLVRQEVGAELKRRGLDTVAIKYSSTSLPPDLRGDEHNRRRTFNRMCCSGRVDGATKLGSTWECDASEWRKARQNVKPPRARLSLVPRGDDTADDDALADAAIASMRARSTR